MKTRRYILPLALVFLAGALVSALLAQRDQQRVASLAVKQSAEGLVSLMSLYPFSDADADRGAQQLLAKSLAERFGSTVAYLVVQAADGTVLFQTGDMALPSPAGGVSSALLRARPGELRFMAPDGTEVLELDRRLIQEPYGGTVRLGVRIPSTPLLSADRVSSVATVVFLMLAAIIAGYYGMILAIRRQEADAGYSNIRASERIDVNILGALDVLRRHLADSEDARRQAADQNAELSSRLAVVAFESRQAYEVLDALDFGILILDPQGRIRRLNRRMLVLLGGERDVYEGHTCGESIAHEAILSLVDDLHDGVAQELLSVEVSFPETTQDLVFEISGRPLNDAAGDRIGALLTTQDITRLKHAEKAQQNFLAEASHELLTPLTSIKSYAELLSTGECDTEETHQEFYNTINQETDRLTDLIRNMLSVSKLEAGHTDMEHGLVKTDWLIDECLPAVLATATEKSVTIEKHLPDVFPTLLGDKELLKVVVVNILGNAVKYTPEGGHVRLALFEQDLSVFVEVTDSGCGIPQEELERVFEKFYRGRSATVRDQVGSGLGLATALQIARLHGGSIDVQSEFGKGACFSVRLPVKEYTLEK